MHPIRRFRTEHRLSQRAFAEHLAAHGVAVTPGLVSHWENERNQPTPEQWPAIEAATEGEVTRAELRPELFN